MTKHPDGLAPERLSMSTRSGADTDEAVDRGPVGRGEAVDRGPAGPGEAVDRGPVGRGEAVGRVVAGPDELARRGSAVTAGSVRRAERVTVDTSARRAERAVASRRKRERRHAIALEIAEQHDGMASIAMLLKAGLTRGQIAGEVERGVWSRPGCHTVNICASDDSDRARWWLALWESGRHSVLDGPTALIAAGLTSWTESEIHVSVPNNATVRSLRGIRHHRLRDIGPVLASGLRRTRPEVAVIRSAQWARTDRQAATLVAMTVQQRLVAPAQLLERWSQVHYSARRAVLHHIIQDVCNGAHSLGELDFAKECRRRGLPEPDRQVVRMGGRGRVYLDVFWDQANLHVEIQGAHHYAGLQVVEDSLRFNDLGLRDKNLTSLQVPVLGLRTRPNAYFAQIAQALKRDSTSRVS